MPAKSIIIGITMGDPSGIGPEICIKAAAALFKKNKSAFRNIIIFGNYNILSATLGALKKISADDYSFDLLKINDSEITEKSAIKIKTISAQENLLKIIHIDTENISCLKKNRPSKESGIAGYKYIEAAVKYAKLNLISAITTAPISKEALKLAGFKWPGHTEILGTLTGTQNMEMAFFGPRLKLILATRHLSLEDAVKKITPDKAYDIIIKAAEYAKLLYKNDGSNVKIIVPALNPHAGEGGLFGRQEEDVLKPAVKKANLSLADSKGYKFEVIGPLPADTAFYKAYNDYRRTIVAALYHDQGLIPFKMLYFNSGVNITLGLPFIRTSPDHGTAYDIAGKLIADENSMLCAVKLAFKLSRQNLDSDYKLKFNAV